MTRKKLAVLIVLSVIFLLAGKESYILDQKMKYQLREIEGSKKKYYEGVKLEPVSGYRIELISAMVYYEEKAEQIPDLFKVRFFLQQPSEVQLIVREHGTNYHMDQVTPERPWRQGCHNAFDWSTGRVIKELNIKEGVQMHDFNMVARLGKADPSSEEHVAPLLFYHSKCPPEIGAYVFTFKIGSHSSLAYKIFNEESGKEVFSPKQKDHKVRGGQLFSMLWDSSKDETGIYRLVVTGYLLHDNSPLTQTVRFYHRKAIKECGGS